MWVCASSNVAASPSQFVIGDNRFNRFAQGIYITLPYTLSVFMVRYFQGSSASEEQIGRNTGVLSCGCPAYPHQNTLRFVACLNA